MRTQMKAEEQFRFGGTSYRAIKKIRIPCHIGNQEMKIETIVVEGEITLTILIL